jgi:hypothetical protein
LSYYIAGNYQTVTIKFHKKHLLFSLHLLILTNRFNKHYFTL